MDLNFGIGTNEGPETEDRPGGSRYRKELAKALLRAHLAAFDRRDAPALLSLRVEDLQGQALTWTRTGYSECPECTRTRIDYLMAEPPNDTARFCPECWTLDMFRAGEGRVAHATEGFERMLRRLPPGARITAIEINGTRIEAASPVDPTRGEPN